MIINKNKKYFGKIKNQDIGNLLRDNINKVTIDNKLNKKGSNNESSETENQISIFNESDLPSLRAKLKEYEAKVNNYVEDVGKPQETKEKLIRIRDSIQRMIEKAEAQTNDRNKTNEEEKITNNNQISNESEVQQTNEEVKGLTNSQTVPKRSLKEDEKECPTDLPDLSLNDFEETSDKKFLYRFVPSVFHRHRFLKDISSNKEEYEPKINMCIISNHYSVFNLKGEKCEIQRDNSEFWKKVKEKGNYLTIGGYTFGENYSDDDDEKDLKFEMVYCCPEILEDNNIITNKQYTYYLATETPTTISGNQVKEDRKSCDDESSKVEYTFNCKGDPKINICVYKDGTEKDNNNRQIYGIKIE